MLDANGWQAADTEVSWRGGLLVRSLTAGHAARRARVDLS